jgi:hypothetical protein
MRKAFLIVVGVGLAAVTLSGCAPATSSGGAAGSGGSSSAPAAGGSGVSGGSTASLPSGKIAMCTAFTPAALSSASGKSFSGTLETDTDGVYGCAYNSSAGTWDWIVDVRVPSDGDTPGLDGLDLGGPSAVKHVDGTGYPAVASKAGVDLQVGKDVVEVYTPSSDPAAQATTSQFVAVAKAAIAALSK